MQWKTWARVYCIRNYNCILSVKREDDCSFEWCPCLLKISAKLVVVACTNRRSCSWRIPTKVTFESWIIVFYHLHLLCSFSNSWISRISAFKVSMACCSHSDTVSSKVLDTLSNASRIWLIISFKPSSVIHDKKRRMLYVYLPNAKANQFWELQLSLQGPIAPYYVIVKQ